MVRKEKTDTTIDEYIVTFPDHIQKKLNEISAVIRSEVPQVGERIAYGIPTFTMNGNLVHFAGYEGHIGFYPTPSAMKEFKNEMRAYKMSKGRSSSLSTNLSPRTSYEGW